MGITKRVTHMTRRFEWHDGLKVVVETYEDIELDQVEQEVVTRQQEADTALSVLGDCDPEDREALYTAAVQHAKAKAALEDSKSEFADAQGVVDQAAAHEDARPDGAADDSGAVPVGVTVADSETEFQA